MDIKSVTIESSRKNSIQIGNGFNLICKFF